jgi:hypothetical protein
VPEETSLDGTGRRLDEEARSTSITITITTSSMIITAILNLASPVPINRGSDLVRVIRLLIAAAKTGGGAVIESVAGQEKSHARAAITGTRTATGCRSLSPLLPAKMLGAGHGFRSGNSFSLLTLL